MFAATANGAKHEPCEKSCFIFRRSKHCRTKVKKGILKTDVKLLYQATEAQLSSSLSASRPWNDIANQRAEFERYAYRSVAYRTVIVT